VKEDRFMKAARIAARALELYESVQGELNPEEKMMIRSRLLEQALRLLERDESSEK